MGHKIICFLNAYRKYIGVEYEERVGDVYSDAAEEERDGERTLHWYLHSYLFIYAMISQGDGWISNSAAGLCFDFHPADPR